MELRAPREEEFHTVYEVACAAFGGQWTQEDEDGHRLGFPFDRGLCAFENGKMVATSAVYSLELTLPGRVTLPTGGVTWIATLPTHRRQGLLRELMAAQFADMVDRGEPVSALLASEANIYGRFGYGAATSVLGFSVERPYSALAIPLDRANAGRFRLLSADEAATQLPSLYESFRLSQPGAVSRPLEYWRGYLADPPCEREGANGMLHVIHETAGGTPDGYVSYRVKEDWTGSTPGNRVMVVELMAADLGAYRALWDYVLNTDLSQSTLCWRGRVDEPLRWLLADSRRFNVTSLSDFLWLRLLDVPRALAARAYGTEGELVFDVTGTFPEPNAARLLLRTGPDATPEAECTRTTRAADLALDIADLGATYLGGVAFAALAAAGRVRELRPGAIERADTMFGTGVAPHCSTMF